jgi:deazaflavin-dependent oxidoreductase (nitroreductase family)
MELTDLQAWRLRRLFRVLNRLMVILFRLGLGAWGNASKYGGYIMVIKNTGRKSGLSRLTPVNYAIVNDDVYCTAGFGEASDWYRNIMTNPQVEIWLPNGRWAGVAEDVTGLSDRASIFRQVIIASGFAGLLFGVNQKIMSDSELDELLAHYRLIRIRRTGALTGPGGPGDLAWVWPLTTLVLLFLLVSRRSGRKRSRA